MAIPTRGLCVLCERAVLATTFAPMAAVGRPAPATLSVLTVGDGDLSYSLALQLLGPALRLTATTLLSSEELLSTYSGAAAADELHTRGAAVLFGVDATALCGLSLPRAAGRRHIQLPASRRRWPRDEEHCPAACHPGCALPQRGGRCSRLVATDPPDLSGKQPSTWGVEAAARLGLTLQRALVPRRRQPSLARRRIRRRRSRHCVAEWAARRSTAAVRSVRCTGSHGTATSTDGARATQRYCGSSD